MRIGRYPSRNIRLGDRFYQRSTEWFGIALTLFIADDVGFETIHVGVEIDYTPINFAWAIVSNFILVPLPLTPYIDVLVLSFH